MSSVGSAVLVSAGALTAWIVQYKSLRRRREELRSAQRGYQTASSFAALFHTPTERFVAEKIFNYLQLETITGQFSFQKDDLLWDAPLSFAKDDLVGSLRFGFWHQLNLGLSAELYGFASQIMSRVKTVGELVCEISCLYEQRYGSIKSSQK